MCSLLEVKEIIYMYNCEIIIIIIINYNYIYINILTTVKLYTLIYVQAKVHIPRDYK